MGGVVGLLPLRFQCLDLGMVLIDVGMFEHQDHVALLESVQRAAMRILCRH